MFQNKKGFTLIELMVVIAIIAILATVVLVALQGARDAAEDSKRKSAVTQLRSIAEIRYATNDQKYTGFNDRDTNKDFDHLMEGVKDDFEIIVGVAGDGKSYCAAVELVSEDGKTFCISNLEGPSTYDTDEVICAATVGRCVAETTSGD